MHLFHLLSCRPFTVPQVLRKGNKPEEEEDDDEEEEETLQVQLEFRHFERHKG